MPDKQQFETGAQRDTDEGKLRYDLIPPSSLARLAKRYTDGAGHYGDHNWTKGIPSSRHLQSLMRHLEGVRAGDTSEDHAAAIAWNAFAIMFNEDCLPDQHDLDSYPWVKCSQTDKPNEPNTLGGFKVGDPVTIKAGNFFGQHGWVCAVFRNLSNGIDVTFTNDPGDSYPYCPHEIELGWH